MPVRLTPRFSTNAGQLLHDAALEGLGLALLPDWFVADDVRARRLVRVLETWTAETTIVYALYRTSLRNEQRVKTMMGHLRQAFGDGTWRTTTTPARRSPRIARR